MIRGCRYLVARIIVEAIMAIRSAANNPEPDQVAERVRLLDAQQPRSLNQGHPGVNLSKRLVNFTDGRVSGNTGRMWSSLRLPHVQLPHVSMRQEQCSDSMSALTVTLTAKQ
jgi:hypothetical protein